MLHGELSHSLLDVVLFVRRNATTAILDIFNQGTNTQLDYLFTWDILAGGWIHINLAGVLRISKGASKNNLACFAVLRKKGKGNQARTTENWRWVQRSLTHDAIWKRVSCGSVLPGDMNVGEARLNSMLKLFHDALANAGGIADDAAAAFTSTCHTVDKILVHRRTNTKREQASGVHVLPDEVNATVLVIDLTVCENKHLTRISRLGGLLEDGIQRIIDVGATKVGTEVLYVFSCLCKSIIVEGD